jgi:hypothetical protein
MRVPSNVQTKATLSMPCQHWPAVVKHCLPAERRQQQQPAFPSRMRRKLKLISSVRSLSRRSSAKGFDTLDLKEAKALLEELAA